MTVSKNDAARPTKRRVIDPILQEVYDIKAKLNADANYSVKKLLEQAFACLDKTEKKTSRD
jgi:hypothetical protein